MYLCVCREITERDVRTAIVLGARTVDDITGCPGDANSCGGCHQAMEAALADALVRELAKA